MPKDSNSNSLTNFVERLSQNTRAKGNDYPKLNPFGSSHQTQVQNETETNQKSDFDLLIKCFALLSGGMIGHVSKVSEGAAVALMVVTAVILIADHRRMI